MDYIKGFRIFQMKNSKKYYWSVSTNVIPIRLHSATCVGFVVGSSTYKPYACVAFSSPPWYPVECNLVSQQELLKKVIQALDEAGIEAGPYSSRDKG